jgi:hypothetical protein
LLTVFIAHAEANAEVARQLGAFLKVGCPVSIFDDDGRIEDGEDLIATADKGLAADVLVLLLSAASNPTKWVRERWEPVLVTRASELGTRVAVMLLEECNFPALLRRGAGFCDATANCMTAWRRLKRWIWGIQLGSGPAMTFSADLEEIYREVADQVGVGSAPPQMARRFAREVSREFEAVLWIPAYERSLAQVVCETGAQLGMRLPGPLAEDCRLVKGVLSERRCLLVMDAPTVRVKAMLPEGRSSVLFTSEPEVVVKEEPGVPDARRLLAEGRVSEAYEILTKLLECGVQTEQCARELVWIYEQWDRIEEANSLRFLVGEAPAEQLRLF